MPQDAVAAAGFAPDQCGVMAGLRQCKSFAIAAAIDYGVGLATEWVLPMYVCLCNGFTDRQVLSVADEGCCSTAGVYRALGARPRCGKCVPTVLGILRRTGAAPDAPGEGAATA
jgi:bacterioferritin-associated ferredoxin